MRELKPISYKNLIKRLKSFGFNGPYPGGKYQFMIKEDKRLIIPNPHRNQISVDLLIRILKQAEIKREDWIKITQDN